MNTKLLELAGVVVGIAAVTHFVYWFGGMVLTGKQGFIVMEPNVGIQITELATALVGLVGLLSYLVRLLPKSQPKKSYHQRFPQ